MSYINIGKVTEELNELAGDKVAKGHEVIEFQAPTVDNGYTWYRKYADGWVEQGGICTSHNYQTITFPITMIDKNYNVQLTPRRTSTTQAGDANDQVLFNNCTVNSIYVYVNNTANNGVFWEVKGMAAA